MDVFVEHIVKRKYSFGDLLFKALVMSAGIVLTLALTIYIGPYGFLIGAAGIYGAWWLAGTRDIEFEYSLTNGEMDVDRIVAKRSRGRVVSFDCRSIEIMAPLDERYENRFEGGFSATIDVSSRHQNRRRYFCVFNVENRGRIRLIFEPTDQMLEAIKAAAPRKVFD